MALAREELARRMRAARSRSGKSQDEVAELAGLSLRQYNRYETAKGSPREDKIPRLAQALGVSVEHLDEPQQQTVIERLERQMTDNAAMTRSALGLLDQLLAEVRANRAALTGATEQVSARLELLEARIETQEALTREQREFLRALGAPAPPPAAGAHGRASSNRSTSTEGSSP